MFSLNYRSNFSIVIAALLLGASSGAYAEDRAVAEARAGIQKTLDDTLAAMRRGENVDEIAKLIFTDDVVIAVAGGETYHGMSEFKPTLSRWIKEPIASWTIEEPLKASGNLAAAFIIEEMLTNEQGERPVYRSLWVFEKGPNGWRSSREALVGTFPDDQVQ